MDGNIHITDSYKVAKRDFEKVLLGREWDAYAECNQSEIVVFQNRIHFSLKMEWACHNFLYNLGIARERTASVDLNYPNKWEWLYIIGGIAVWLFVR